MKRLIVKIQIDNAKLLNCFKYLKFQINANEKLFFF